MGQISINKSKVLIVEGLDEVNFFTEYLSYLKLMEIQVIPYCGRGRLNEHINDLIKLPGFDSINIIGFIQDADFNTARSSFDSMVSVLNSYNIPCPDNPGGFATSSELKSGIFIMPNNQDEGMLEDLFLCILSDTEKDIISCIQGFQACFKNLPNCGLNQRNDVSKSLMLSYFAYRNPEVYRVGIGAQKGYFDFSHGCLSKIKEFLEELYQ
ncbi:MAG TPA: hypothetical protein DC057_19355 [Spirochaetia bacterium]|nr:MAG: hypothetical protein A2014_11635 [Spirochaetes bacterium GWF1_49_6]HBD96336.1 hypothetical protein [Spirochaetia bacterium]